LKTFFIFNESTAKPIYICPVNVLTIKNLRAKYLPYFNSKTYLSIYFANSKAVLLFINTSGIGILETTNRMKTALAN